MKTTFDLPDDLVREVKLRAVVQGRTVEKPPAGSLVEIGQTGLPLIRCRPGAPATRMSVGDLLKLEQKTQTEEDLKRAGLPS